MSPPSSDVSEFESIAEVDELRRVLAQTQAKLKQAKAKTEDLIGAVHQGARDAALVLGNPPAVKPPPADRRKAKAEVAVLLLSDWQIGKRTASFDSEVAAKRLAKLGDKVVRIADVERADHPVREIHNLLNGDMIENVGIFPGQAFEVDSAAFTQLFCAVGAIERLVRQQLSCFERVHCWEEYGNHGRVGRKGDHPSKDNVDLLVYRIARERLSEHEKTGRLVWHESQGWHSIVEIGAYRALLVHGDEIKGFGGQTPAFGILRKCNAWASGVVAPFTDVYMSHFHQPLVLPLANGRGRVFVNPSIESDNVYAKEFVGATGTPGQRLNFIEPDAGRVTSERIIWLDD